MSDVDESRRQFLLYLLASGAFSPLAGCGSGGTQTYSRPKEMPTDRSIYQMKGDVRVNNVAATLDTLIGSDDVVETFDRSYVIFVVSKDAFILRSDSRMKLPAPVAASSFHLDRGKLLSVLASRRTQITTPSAIIGIRGTGIYVESEPDRSYVCTCYGESELKTEDQSTREIILSEHHDAPRYILADKSLASRIQPAPFKNHEDIELLLIETLVGRTTPYIVPGGLSRSRTGYF